MQLGSDDLFLFSEDRLCCQFYDKAASWSHWNPAIYYKGKIVVFYFWFLRNRAEKQLLD